MRISLIGDAPALTDLILPSSNPMKRLMLPLIRQNSLVNIIQSSPNDPVAITSLTPNAGFTLSDGIILPSPVILCPGGCFMWDVGHPTQNGKDEMGREWDGWSEEKLKVFEVLNPRPGELRSLPLAVG